MAPPLWRVLQAAAGVIGAVRAGESATPAIARVEPALRPAAQALAFAALRQLGRADALRRQLAHRAPPPAADALLLTALALAWDEARAPYPPHTLVDQAVEAAKRQRSTAAQSGFINGCLRRFLRERDALMAATDADPVARFNHPRWWIERLRRDHPEHWEAMLGASAQPGPMTLRVFEQKVPRVGIQQRLAAINIGAAPVGRQGLVLDRPRPVHELPGFDAGEVSVQDAAAQLAAPLLLDGLAPAEGPLRLLDACAAPGGKTAHLLEMAPKAQLFALDVDPARCERVRQNLARVGAGARWAAEVRAADAASPAAWWDGRPFDGILLDAPCTASGIVRRHPDVPWLRREADIAQLAAQQARLLAALWPLLRPGGRMVYATCSVFRAEGEDQVRSFVAHNTDAIWRPSPGHLIPTCGAKDEPVRDNLAGDHDGFFYAVLDKAAG